MVLEKGTWPETPLIALAGWFFLSVCFPLHAFSSSSHHLICQLGYTALLRQPNQGDQGALYSELRAYGKFTGLCWLLIPEPKQLGDLPVSAVEEAIFSEEFLTMYCCWTTRVYQAKIKDRARNCKSNHFFNCRSEKQSFLVFSEEGAFDCK